ncbi:hypothetical protein GCM10023188_29500 [Pontibacter saemangeumensis]|uniref:HEPN domain-containing protein n=1 Tax=Pontibacter saemangeumensis TaxID=1084525 RepID=A0ABP8LV88_9BACT
MELESLGVKALECYREEAEKILRPRSYGDTAARFNSYEFDKALQKLHEGKYFILYTV